MAKPLSNEEQKYIAELKESSDVLLAKYKAEKEQALKERRVMELQLELQFLEGYLQEVNAGNVDDIAENIDLFAKKAKLLKELLNKK
ncbi:hypothetical protein COV18_06185 [Candidatus Woesearchaeota archaeon CG10_big_fil_rev_8_21_14_0_10_37_12]|nr:MAG: hypothetical protein COV18_06185 [Candidatus Woesearchaeota archaeon CG10_big_fil_rev_8_21_14_0_10_37_12]